VNIITKYEYTSTRKSFLSPATKLPEIKRENKIPYEKSDTIAFRGKNTSSSIKSNSCILNEQYL